MLRRLVMLAAFLVPGLAVQAQDLFVNEYARPGIPTKTVYVWQPATSSIWRVERDIGLVELLTAVGTTTGSSIAGTNSVLTIYRPDGGGRREVFSAPVTDVLAAVAVPPEILDQDILVFEERRRRRLSIATISTYVTTLSALALLYINLSE